MLRSFHAHLLLGAFGTLLFAACDGVAMSRDDERGPAAEGGNANANTDASTNQPGTDAAVNPGKADASADGAAPGCVPQCDARTCGDDQCGGSCGACVDNQRCNADGLCETVTEECPLSVAPFVRSYPDVWAEGECIARWECTNCGAEYQAAVRAHYHQPGNVLYAKKHRTDGQESFVSSGFLSNLGVELRETIAFCEEEPSGSSCARVPVPDCAPYQARASCSTLFNWVHDNRAVRLRRTGTQIWAESQDPGTGSWTFAEAGWLDASGGFPQQHVGYFCFENTKPAGDPEPCP